MQIKEAYLNTNFIVYGSKHKQDDITIKIGSLNEALYKAIPNLTTWAYITAWNPHPEVLTLEENRGRNNELKKYVKQLILSSQKVMEFQKMVCGVKKVF